MAYSRPVQRARMPFAFIACIALFAALFSTGGVAFAAEPAPEATVAVSVDRVDPGPFAPGESFTFTIGYSCSSLTAACENAVLVDALPDSLEWVSHSTTPHPSLVTVSEGVITAAFQQELSDGVVGLRAGTTGSLEVTVAFRADAYPGEVAENCATMSADGLDGVRACADAGVSGGNDYTTSVGNKFQQPSSETNARSGVNGTRPTTTVGLTVTVGGDCAPRTVTLTYPEPGSEPFNSFDLTGIGNVTPLPSGVRATVSVTAGNGYHVVSEFTQAGEFDLPGASGIEAEDVTGLQVVYQHVDATIPVGTSFKLTAGLALRHTVRQAPNPAVQTGTITGTATASATYLTDETATDTASAAYTVVQPVAGAGGATTFTPPAINENSTTQITVAMTGTNKSNTAADRIVVSTGPDGTHPFGIAVFGGFTPLSLPSAVTADVEVHDGAGWQSLGAAYADGTTPALGAIAAASVEGVRFSYSGEIPRNTSITNSFTMTVRPDVDPFTPRAQNCILVEVSIPDATPSQTADACANFSVTPTSHSVHSAFSIAPTSVAAKTGAPITVTLQGRSNSSVPVSGFSLVVPGTGSERLFDFFDFVKFGALKVPNATTWSVEVETSGGWTPVGSGLSAGETPQLPVSLEPTDLLGVRYALTSGTLPTTGGYDERGLDTNVELKLRDTHRSTGMSVDSGTLKGCATSSAPDATDSTTCATVTVNAISTGTGTGATINIAASSMVQGSGGTTLTNLRARNDANVPVHTVVVEHRDGFSTPAGDFWSAFEFIGFEAVVRPVGTTDLRLDYFDGTTWHPLATYAGTGDVTPSLPAGLTPSAVKGLRWSWTGLFQPGTSFATRFQSKLSDSTATGNFKACVRASYDGNLIPQIVTTPCDSIRIVERSLTASSAASFVPVSGVLENLPTTTLAITAKNTSNIAAEKVVAQTPADPTAPGAEPGLFEAFDLTGLELLTSSQVADWVQVDVYAAGAWHNGVAAATLPDLSDGLNTIPIDEIVGLRFTFTNSVTGTISPISTVAVGLNLKLRSQLRSTGEPLVIEPGDSQVFTAGSAAWVIDASNMSSVSTSHTPARYTVTAGPAPDPGSGEPSGDDPDGVVLVPDLVTSSGAHTFAAGDIVIYRLPITNTGTENFLSPIVVDEFPSTLLYDGDLDFSSALGADEAGDPTGGYRFDPNGSTLIGPVTSDLSSAGLLTFTFEDDDYLAPGETAYIDVAFTIDPNAAAGTLIRNWYGIEAPTGAVTCESTDDDHPFGGDYCASFLNITVARSVGLETVLEVRGDDSAQPTSSSSTPCFDDSGFTRSPCLAHTFLGDDFDYRLSVKNADTVAMQRLVLIDVLPRTGDTGVLLGQFDRGSQWQPALATDVTVAGLPADAVTTVYYSTVDNPDVQPLHGSSWDPAVWTILNPGPDTTAIGVDVWFADDAPLASGDSFTLEWMMTAPLADAQPGAIAWNSFAFSGVAADRPAVMVPAAEGHKVGIQLDNISLTVVKSTTGGDGTFTYALAWPGGSEQTAVTTDGSGTYTWELGALVPGAEYTLGELQQDGWTSELDQCSGVTPSSFTTTSITFIAEAGAVIACEFVGTRVEVPVVVDPEDPVAPDDPVDPVPPGPGDPVIPVDPVPPGPGDLVTPVTPVDPVPPGPGDLVTPVTPVDPVPPGQGDLVPDTAPPPTTSVAVESSLPATGAGGVSAL